MAPGLRRNPTRGNWSLAGPQQQQAPPPYDPQGTYVQEGYHEANPFYEQPQSQPEFSLATNFPRTVRWNKKPKDKDPKAVKKPEKGQSEEAPQVAFAEQDGNRPAGQDFGHGDSSHSTDVEDEEKRPGVHRTSTADTATVKQRRIDAYHNGQPQGQIATEETAEEDPSIKPYNHWAYARLYAQRPLAEWLGTTILTFLGISANLNIKTQEPPGSTQSLAWAWGFGLMLAIYIAGGGSGGFVNPAITVMLSVFRGFPAKRLPSYILAQLLGAFTGALLAYAVYQDDIYHFDSALLPASTGTAFYTQPKAWIMPGTAFVTEMLGSAVLGCSILALGDSGNSPPGAGMHALIIGLLLTALILSLGFNTSGCFNPARDLGPRLAVLAVGYPVETFGAYHHWWLWGTWGADCLGTLLGGVLYDVCVFKGGESPVNYSFGRWKVEGKKEMVEWLPRFGKRRKAEQLEVDLENGIVERRRNGKQDTSPD